MTPWFVFTHKVLPLLVMPLGVALALIVWAVISRRRAAMAAAGAILWVSGAPIFADTVLDTLETLYPFRTVEDAPAADAIFVLGGMYGRRPGNSRGEWGPAVDRFETGLALYSAEKAPVLVLSGGATPDDDGPGEGESLSAFALARGVPPDCVVVTEAVPNTEAEARVMAVMMERFGWERILLVTSAFHMPRAKFLFDARGVNAEAILTDYGAGECAWSIQPWDVGCFVPGADGLGKTQLAMRELLGLAYYSLRR